MLDTSIFQDKKAVYYTLGCKLNFSETSTIGRILQEAGIRAVRRGEKADICVINTCSVTEVADKKCRQAIHRLVKQHPGAFVVVTGCYAQLKPDTVAAIDGVDVVLGAEQKKDVLKYLGDLQKHAGPGESFISPLKDIHTFVPSCSRGDRTRFFLKVQDGCDYFCSYCTIPYARGRSRNGSIASLVAQARQAANDGAKEIVLTGVNIGDFGRSTGETFLDLVKALDGVEGIERYRISSIEPDLLADEVIEYVSRSRSFMPHFHIPLQSGCDEVLHLMRRRYDTALFAAKVSRIKALMPDAFIGVDVIVGTRGETEAYFEQTYRLAEKVIKKGAAYVCDLSAEEIRQTRGTLNEPGKESPCRNRSVEENLKLFREMRDGKYPDGSKVLRAKIDMASPNINMRDPVIYRILRAHHHRTGDKWCIYPMYDFAHPIGDALDGVTHSICTMEFEDHRPLYDWVTKQCEFEMPPRQIEFARLNIKNTIMSKRYLKKLVEEGVVTGWNDPRMPTISGMRERGYPPEAIKEFCARVGVAKANSEVDPGLLEFCVREQLNREADRAMVVERPLKVVIDNMSDDEAREFAVENNPNSPESGTHNVILRKEVYIDESDFSLNPPPKYKRLTEGGMIRLKGAYILKHVSTELNADGSAKAVHCEYIPDSQSGGVNAGIKVKGTVQWVSVRDAADVTLNKYESLLVDAKDGVTDFNERLNPNSLTVVTGAKAEPFVFSAGAGATFQFMRMAYYKYAGDNVFYRIVELKDSFNKQL